MLLSLCEFHCFCNEARFHDFAPNVWFIPHTRCCLLSSTVTGLFQPIQVLWKWHGFSLLYLFRFSGRKFCAILLWIHPFVYGEVNSQPPSFMFIISFISHNAFCLPTGTGVNVLYELYHQCVTHNTTWGPLRCLLIYCWELGIYWFPG